MALQPKSKNLPEMQQDAPVVSAAGDPAEAPAHLVTVPGNENAVPQAQAQAARNENLKGIERRSSAQALPHDHVVGVNREMQHALTAQKQHEREPQPQPQPQPQQQQQQQQQQKPSRTDNCHCPDIIEEKVKPVNPEDHDKPRKIIRYERGRFLGKGGFAKCYEVKRIEPIETEEHKTLSWALKVVPKANLTRTKARQKLTSEIKIHRSLDHENVVRFDRYFEDKDNVYIMLDICQNQSLSDLIKRRKRLHEVETRYYTYQLVKAMQYIHSRKVIHRDLKLGNLFLTERMCLKVGDFGLAAQVFYLGEKKRTVCGTPNYLAPEVLENNGHSYHVDCWAIGVILYTMLNGRPPFESPEVKNTYKKIRAGLFQFPEHVQINPYAKDFIKKALTVDLNQRLTLEDMLAHDFLAKVDIPRQIPVSTLVCPPAAAFAKQYALPQKTSMAMANNMSPAPMTSAHVRQQRMLHHMQTAPMENALRQVNRNQKSNGSGAAAANDLKGVVYSPLVVNGRDNSQVENGQIMGSARDGTTPNQNPHLVRTISNGPNFISEFNPMNEEQLRERAAENPAKPDTAAPQGLNNILVDNFLQGQNIVNLAGGAVGPSVGATANPTGKSVPNSPGNAGTISSAFKAGRQSAKQVTPTPASGSASAKTRRLTSSVSSSAIPQPSNTLTQSAYNTNGLGPRNSEPVDTPTETQDQQTSSRQQTQELAKIQPTAASSIEHDLLIQRSEAQPRTELVTKFVDFSSKYGLGYMLSNGSYGVLFNDSTKIILHPNLFHFDYIERPKQQPTLNANGQAAESLTDQVSQFDFFNYPESINKKVVLLQHFKSYLDGNQKFKPLEFSFTKENAPKRAGSSEAADQLVYIKKWKRAKKAILLRNTNKVIQVMFQDQSELILCSGSGFVTFVNSKQEVEVLPLSAQNDNLEQTNKSLFKRLQYAKEILVQMMSASSMPPSLALSSNQPIEPLDAPLPQQRRVPGSSYERASQASNYLSNTMKPSGQQQAQSKASLAATGRFAKSASKNQLMSPYTHKSATKPKESGRIYRMQTLTATKGQQSTNLLNSNLKPKGKFELPLLSNRSSSKPSIVQTKNQMNLVAVGTNAQTCANQNALTQSHNFLPTKIGAGVVKNTVGGTPQTQQKQGSVARLYSSQALARENSGSAHGAACGEGTPTGSGGVGPSAPKISSAKSPGKSFKQRNSGACPNAQLTTLAGSGVRKQQFSAKLV